MCNILYKPLGVKAIPVEWLRNVLESNGDGWGVTIRFPGHPIMVYKGFNREEFIHYASYCGEDAEVVTHVRFATHGEVKEYNLHPFELKTDGETFGYLYHNGIAKVEIKEKKFSDTWHVARIIEKLGEEKLLELCANKKWVRRVRKTIGTFNKFVIHSDNGVTIVNEEDGMWEDGIWSSNDNHQDWKWDSGSYKFGSYQDQLAFGASGHELLALWEQSGGDFYEIYESLDYYDQSDIVQAIMLLLDKAAPPVKKASQIVRLRAEKSKK